MPVVPFGPCPFGTTLLAPMRMNWPTEKPTELMPRFSRFMKGVVTVTAVDCAAVATSAAAAPAARRASAVVLFVMRSSPERRRPTDRAKADRMLERNQQGRILSADENNP